MGKVEGDLDLTFSNVENPRRFVSSPDFHIKGTTQSAKLKIDLDKAKPVLPSREGPQQYRGGRMGGWGLGGRWR